MPSAQLRPFSVLAPGSFGLNTQSAIEQMDPRYALQNLNSVQDILGRTGSRKGYVSQTNTISGTDVQQVFEYVKQDGSLQLLACANNTIYTVTLPVTDGASGAMALLTTSVGAWG